MSNPAKPKPFDLAGKFFHPGDFAEALAGKTGGPLGAQGAGFGRLGGRFGYLGEEGEAFDAKDYFNPDAFYAPERYFNPDAAMDDLANALAERYTTPRGIG